MASLRCHQIAYNHKSELSSAPKILETSRIQEISEYSTENGTEFLCNLKNSPNTKQIFQVVTKDPKSSQNFNRILYFLAAQSSSKSLVVGLLVYHVSEKVTFRVSNGI